MFALAHNESLEDSGYLGPARVGRVAGARVGLDLPDGRVWAQSALGYSYRVTPGDTVLAIGRNGAWFVIGVLEGRGKTTFTAPGDIEFRAPRGRIDLISAEGLRLRSPSVKICSDELEIVARSVRERFNSARRWVKDTFEVRAGRSRTLVEKTHRLMAGRIVERAEGDVKIDGRKIHLG